MSFHTTSSVFSLPKNARCNSQNLNLYHYAGNNPVKYVDPDGRKILTVTSRNKMNEGAWKNHYINNSTDLMKSYGCAITAMSNILTTLSTKNNGGWYQEYLNVTPAIINNKKSNFIAENTDCLDFVNTAKMMNLSAVAYDGVVARNKLIELNNSENEVYVIARVPFSYISASTGSQENGLHYVNVNGELVTDENDITWLKVGPTSTNDGPARTINDNWKSENGNMYVKVSAVEKIVVLE